MVTLCTHSTQSLAARDRNLETPLILATRCGQFNSVVFLLKKGAKINSTDRLGRNCLIFAIKSGNVELVSKMMELQPNMNFRDKEWGWTPLHFAAHSGSIELTAMCIDAGADIYLKSTKEKNTSLDISISNEHTGVEHFLREYLFSEPAQAINPDDPTVIWLGDKEAAYPLWCSKIGFKAIISIFSDPSGERPRKTYWLDDEGDSIDHYKVHLTKDMMGSIGDDEAGEGEWEVSEP